ncbi:hypothetical protein K7X08_037268 [Anisodus acutangulus]|uniref:PORR domain-containing protein n=1 Tax=Anisodus acutangulus TaxID=402998 RepID=A0A9Q1RRV2_9SOLA|nr:hypothetical protein K7X08_037268 [Anisodus acutangulus]
MEPSKSCDELTSRSAVVRKKCTFGGVERYEKRAVAIIHEVLSLTVEKLVPVERLAHIKKDLCIEVNIRELLLKHPGIFYISTKGITEIVFLSEAYSKGCLIESNPIYDLRRKMLELLLLGNRRTRELGMEREVKDESEDMTDDENGWESREGDFVIPILESFADDNNDILANGEAVIFVLSGFKLEPGFREKLENWQRLPYVKPYERESAVARKRTFGGVERYEKRAVVIIHEILSLTAEKLVPVERLAHFKKDLGIEVNIRELLLKHPGIFYISTKGITEIVFLSEAYSKGCLIESNPIYGLRRKMLELLLLGNRHTRELGMEREVKDESEDMADDENGWESGEGDFVIPILESFTDP